MKLGDVQAWAKRKYGKSAVVETKYWPLPSIDKYVQLSYLYVDGVIKNIAKEAKDLIS